MNDVNCQYCNNPAKLTSGKEIYPNRKDLFKLNFWICRECEAYVGCHKNGPGISPLGTLAKAPLRKLRTEAHAHFDPIWKTTDIPRNFAYHKLAEFMGISPDKCHISMFNEKQCKKVLKFTHQTMLALHFNQNQK